MNYIHSAKVRSLHLRAQHSDYTDLYIGHKYRIDLLLSDDRRNGSCQKTIDVVYLIRMIEFGELKSENLMFTISSKYWTLLLI